MATKTATMESVAPILLARDVGAAVAYWRDRLGFDQVQLFGEPTDFAIVARDGVRVMLAAARDGAVPEPNWKLRSSCSNLYIRVDDARALHAEVKERGAPIDFELYETPWGTLEFGSQDPDGHDISFGQEL